MARALRVLGRRWPWPDGSSLRLLDYQVPLKARQDDAGTGKIDLLGVTEVGEVGRFVVVELKIDYADGGLGDSPPAAPWSMRKKPRASVGLAAGQSARLGLSAGIKARYHSCA
jgi:hypothetical protein